MMSSKTKKDDMKRHEAIAPSEIFKLIDDLNVKIVKELVTRPDISSTEIASKYKIPLSTIQRRRARLEEAVIKNSIAWT